MCIRDSYRAELEANDDREEIIEKVKALLQKENVTLLYGSKDPLHNNAVVLKEWLYKKIRP